MSTPFYTYSLAREDYADKRPSEMTGEPHDTLLEESSLAVASITNIIAIAISDCGSHRQLP